MLWDCLLFGPWSLRTFSKKWLSVQLRRGPTAATSSLMFEDVRISSIAEPKLYTTEGKGAMTHHSSHASISTDLNLVSFHELFEHTQDVFNLIARRAFEIFESRGHVDGSDREDWFLAESELLTPVKFHLSESGEELTAHAEAPGFTRQEIKVSLEPRRLSISAKAEPHDEHQPGKHTHSHRHARLMFRVIDLPAEVDLSKAKATYDDGKLEILMPKAAPAKSVRVETKLGASAEGHTSAHEGGGIEAAGSEPVVTGAHEASAKTHAASSSK
jgi:HSP20 family protein